MVLLTVAIGGCRKAATSNRSDIIDFTIDAAATNITVTSNFGVNIQIHSFINPLGGIKVESIAMEEITSGVISPQAPDFITKISANNTSIINLPRQKWVIATIKLTDIADAGNTATRVFRVIYK